MAEREDAGRQHAPAVQALRELVRLPTVSRRPPEEADPEPFEAFGEALARPFPLLHEHLELETVATYGVLARWPARPGGEALDPVVLMAHLDVVPVDDPEAWTHDPFGAELVDTDDGPAVWGRGTLDDKGELVGICAAVEELLAAGFSPARDVWLSFGPTEEVSGPAAAEAVAVLRERGVRPWFVLDEGGAVAHEAFPGVSAPVAVVGVTEKGMTALELRVTGPGGHASTPSAGSPVVRLARAIDRLDRSPMPSRLAEPVAELLGRLARRAALPLRPVLAAAGSVGALSPAVARLLVLAGPEGAAMTRTTFAITTLRGSAALNVVAPTATAGVDVRVMPGDTVADVVEHVRRAVDDDAVDVRVLEAGEASPVSPRDDAFGLVERVVSEVFPDAVPAPYVMMAGTDSRHFTTLCPRVYRFAPLRMTKQQRQSIHGVDEHVLVEAFLDGVRWYRRLLEELPG
ncbi:MAG: acetylornithine deacetylase [Nocardioides sp.]|nr:acetylornithine deacetylase [Nocardioides sp.]